MQQLLGRVGCSASALSLSFSNPPPTHSLSQGQLQQQAKKDAAAGGKKRPAEGAAAPAPQGSKKQRTGEDELQTKFQFAKIEGLEGAC